MNAYAGNRNREGTSKRTSLQVIFLIMLMDVMGLSILFPVAPYIVQHYSSDALMVTLLSVIYAGAQFFAAPALGKISDRVGRRPVLLISVLGSAVGYFVFGAAGALWVLFLSRLIDGITGGNMSTAMACIADTSTAEERPKNFVLVGMAYGLGFVLGPALGGPLGQLNLDAPAYAAGVLSLISLLLIFVALPESLPKQRRETSPLRLDDFNPLASIGSMMRKPGLAPLMISYALFNLAFDGVNSTTGVFISRKFLAEPWHLGLIFVVSGLALGVVQGLFTPRLVAKIGEKSTAMFGLLGNAVGGLMLFAAPALWMLYPVVFFSGSVTGFIWAPVATLAANQVSEREQGQLAGVNAAVSGLMAAIGPLWAGFTYDHVMAGSPYWISAAIIVLAVLVLGRARLAARAGRQVTLQSPADWLSVHDGAGRAGSRPTQGEKMDTRPTIDRQTVAVAEPFTTGFTRSKDGTRIGFRQIGRGPAIVILHGSMSTGYNHIQLAALLSDTFTVYIPDRRGFGLSDAAGEDDGVQQDVEDLDSVLNKTGARNVFGVSLGAIIALRAAMTLPAIRKLAAYEPPLFTDPAVPAAVMARFDQEMAQGKVAAALTTAMKGVPLASDAFNAMPRWLVEFMTGRMMAFEDKNGPGDYATFRQLAPSLHHDGHVITEMSGKQADLRTIRAELLLLGGGATTSFLKEALRSVRTVLPQAQYVELPGLNHSSSWNSDRGGKPDRIAQELRRFFA